MVPVMSTAALSLQQLLAASALVEKCRKIAASGRLSEAEEQDLRVLVARASRAFEIDTIAERGDVLTFAHLDAAVSRS